MLVEILSYCSHTLLWSLCPIFNAARKSFSGIPYRHWKLADPRAALGEKWGPTRRSFVERRVKTHVWLDQGNREDDQELLGHCLRWTALYLRIYRRRCFHAGFLFLEHQLEGDSCWCAQWVQIKSFWCRSHCLYALCLSVVFEELLKSCWRIQCTSLPLLTCIFLRI